MSLKMAFKELEISVKAANVTDLFLTYCCYCVATNRIVVFCCYKQKKRLGKGKLRSKIFVNNFKHTERICQTGQCDRS